MTASRKLLRFHSVPAFHLFSVIWVSAVIWAAASAGALAQGPEGFADLVEAHSPAVVNISTTQKVSGRRGILQLPPGSPYEEWFEEFMDRFGDGENGESQPLEREVTSLGSGFIVDSDGVIVTNHHVVAEADEITVTLSDGTELPAEVVGRDPKTDLAVIKVTYDVDLPALEFGDSDAARVGDWVVAIGNPYGLGGSVTAGIISARGRNLNGGPYEDFIQVDAPINRGNSGGPLFNMDGEVIGINTAIFSPTGGNVGIGFAVPSNLARTIVEELLDKGEVERGWLGVQIQAVTDEIAESLGLEETKGVLIAKVFEGDPADRAGIEPGDVIVEYNGVEIEDLRTLQRAVADTPVNERVNIVVWRNGERKRLRAVVGRMEEEEVAAAPSETPDEDLVSREILGMELASLTSETRDAFDIPEEVENGVVVVQIDTSSDAWRKGVRRGDIIRQAQFVDVDSPDDVREQIRKLQTAGKKNITLGVSRGEAFLFIGVSLPQND